MGFIAILFFFGFLALGIVWSLVTAGVTVWLRKRYTTLNVLVLASLNLGLVLLPLHGVVSE